MSPSGRVVTPENSNHFYFGGLFFRADMWKGGFLAMLVPHRRLRLRFVGEMLLLYWLAGARADSPPHRPNQLEGEFQSKLHHALASRPD